MSSEVRKSLNSRFHANKRKLNVRSTALNSCLIKRLHVKGNYSYQSYTAQEQPVKLGSRPQEKKAEASATIAAEIK